MLSNLLSELSYNEQLSLLVIDKLLIALALVLVGFGLNRLLEKFKSIQARTLELEKLRAPAMSEVWGRLARAVKRCNDTEQFPDLRETDAGKYRSLVNGEFDQVISDIEQSRLLTGNHFADDIFRIVTRYYNYYIKLPEALASENQDFSIYPAIRKDAMALVSNFSGYLDELQVYKAVSKSQD